MRRYRAWGIGVMGSTLGLTAAVVLYLGQCLPVPKPRECWIAPGKSVREALAQIASDCHLRMPWLFVSIGVLYAWGTGSRVFAGMYRFGPEQRYWQLLRALFTGRQVLRIRVTIPEGLTIVQIASLLQREANVDSADFVSLAFSDSLTRARGIPVASVEGYLMPETYELFWRHPAEDVLERLLREQDRLWQERFAEAAQKRGLSRHEVLTLASIIEAETPHADERRRVSGVFWNRLRRGMPLQADPTVAYALGKPGHALTRADLSTPHPYNTYTTHGLPPGPINNPSADAIAAALEPEEHQYLYFVLLRDGSYRHAFSQTYREHRKLVALQRQLRP